MPISPPTLFKNSLWNTLGYSYLLLASLISIPFLVHGLGLTSYSHYLVVVAVVTVASSLDLGLPTALTRSLATFSATKTQLRNIRTGLLGSAIVILFICLASYLIILLFSHLLPSGLSDLIISLLAPALSLVAVTQLLSYLGAIPQGLGDFGVANTRAFVVGTGNTLLSASVALATGSVSAVLWVQVASSLLCLLLLIFYTVGQFGSLALLPSYSRLHLKPLLSFGISVFVGNLAPQIEANLARVVSSASLTPPMLSALGIAQSLVQKWTGLFNQFTNAFLPRASALASTKQFTKLKRVVWLTTVAFFLATLLVLTASHLFGMPLLGLWLDNPELVSSVYPLLSLYLLVALVISLTPSPATALTAAGYPHLPARTAWIHLGLEIILLLILLPSLGAPGAPLASLLASLAPTGLLLWYVKKRLP